MNENTPCLTSAPMGQTTRGAVVIADFDWNDIGSWSALWDIAEKDINENVLSGDVILKDTKNSYIRSEGRQLVTTIGIEDMIVISTDDAVMIRVVRCTPQFRNFMRYET